MDVELGWWFSLPFIHFILFIHIFADCHEAITTDKGVCLYMNIVSALMTLENDLSWVDLSLLFIKFRESGSSYIWFQIMSAV